MKTEQKDVLIFGGTSEGRALCEHLHVKRISFTVCVATEYGEECLSHMPGADVRTGRLMPEEIAALVPAYKLVLDATHPYAKEVTGHIRTACATGGIPYLRVLRPSLSGGSSRYFADIPAVCAFLSSCEGKILVTTGSKELLLYSEIPDYQHRLYVRVLPSAASLQECLAAGIPSSHIIAMQGPFSKELNAALLRQTEASFLVTKESGTGGGFAEKIEAANALGVTPLIIGRPTEETGISFDEAICALNLRFPSVSDAPSSGYFPLFFNLRDKPVTVVGGGTIALRRVNALLPFGPRITVVAPQVEPALAEFHTLCRAYQAEDIAGSFFVLAATNDPDINRQVAADCRALGIPVNRCDDKNGSDFYFPALFQNDTLIGGLVSKQGDSHRLVKEAAGTLRRLIQEKEFCK